MPTPKSKSEFQSAFDSHVMPDQLLALLEFQLEHPSEPYSGQFIVYYLPPDSNAWSDETAPFLTAFGQHDGNGSLYAFWAYSGQPLSDSPIVYLDSEGVDNNLVAANFGDFLRLLALDIDVLGYCYFGEHDDYFGTDLNSEYRKWLMDEFQMEAPNNPDVAVSSARSKHPDFNKWLDEMAGSATNSLPSTDTFWSRLAKRLRGAG